MAPLKLTQPNCCHFCVTSFGHVITKLWSSLHVVTPYSYNLYLLSRLLLKLGVFGKSGIVERWRSSFFLKHKVEQTVRFLMFLGILLNTYLPLIRSATSIRQLGHHVVSTVECHLLHPDCCCIRVEMVGQGLF